MVPPNSSSLGGGSILAFDSLPPLTPCGASIDLPDKRTLAVAFQTKKRERFQYYYIYVYVRLLLYI